MTELSWEGKYDADGKKTAPLRVAPRAIVDGNDNTVVKR